MRGHSQNLKAELYLPNAVNEIIRAHNARVKVLVTGENWFGITYKEDRASVKEKIMELVKEGLYPENLWKGS
jgi:hypothetical protein